MQAPRYFEKNGTWNTQLLSELITSIMGREFRVYIENDLENYGNIELDYEYGLYPYCRHAIHTVSDCKDCIDECVFFEIICVGVYKVYYSAKEIKNRLDDGYYQNIIAKFGKENIASIEVLESEDSSEDSSVESSEKLRNEESSEESSEESRIPIRTEFIGKLLIFKLGNKIGWERQFHVLNPTLKIYSKVYPEFAKVFGTERCKNRFMRLVWDCRNKLK